MANVIQFCQKHELPMHYYGGSSERRCPECERDAELSLMHYKLNAIMRALDLDIPTK